MAMDPKGRPMSKTPDPTDTGVVVATAIEVPKPERPDYWIGVELTGRTVSLWSNYARDSERELLTDASAAKSMPRFIVCLPGTSAPGPKAEDAVAVQEIIVLLGLIKKAMKLNLWNAAKSDIDLAISLLGQLQSGAAQP